MQQIPLDSLSKAQWAVLRTITFASNPVRQNEVMYRSRTSCASMLLALRRFTESGLLQRMGVGNNVLYSLNSDHPQADFFAKAFREEDEIQGRFAGIQLREVADRKVRRVFELLEFVMKIKQAYR